MGNPAIIRLELTGIMGIATGVAIESILHLDVGFIDIIIGSVMVAIGGLVWCKVYRRE